jgi:hypothetical protein
MNNNMKMQYFTEKGFDQVQINYNLLIGNSYFFDDTETKHELIGIIKHSTAHVAGGLHISFLADNGKTMPIDVFTTRNKITYNFQDFDRISI